MELVRKTIGEAFTEEAKSNPNGIFMNYKDHSYTWGIVDNITTNLAKMFMKEGIKKGDSVGITGINSDSYILIFLALQKIGARAVLINNHYKGLEIRECIAIANIKYMFFADIQEERIMLKQELEKDAKKLGFKVYTVYSDFDIWMSYAHNPEEDTDFEKIDADDTAIILFTSGTTNKCKGVQLSHYNLINNALQVAKDMRWNENDKLCLTVPLFHCFGISISLLTCIVSGMEVIVLEKFRTVTVCEAIQSHKCTVLNGVPSMFMAMMRNENTPNYDLTSLRSGIIAGSAITPKEYYKICDTFSTMHLQSSYGLTEASPCVTISDYDDTLERKANSVGKVIEHVEVSIYNMDTGEPCEVGQWGEIYVKGYNITKGYLSCDAQVCQAVTTNGELITGDLGYFDENGYLYIVGRRKNLIIRGGENISPTEIVEYIDQVEDNLNIFVLGVKSEVMQEDIVACIEGDNNPELETKIRNFLDKNLSKYKIPKYFVFIKEFPTTATGKIDQRKIKEIVEKHLGIE